MSGFVTNEDPLAKSEKILPRLEPDPPQDEDDAPSMFEAELAGFGVIPPPPDMGDGLDPLDVATPTDGEVQELVKQLEPLARDYYDTKASSRIAAAYRAARNEHPSGSKYTTDAYKARSRYFRPKSKQAIRKALTAAANSLFATTEVVEVMPGDESNPQHRANADLMKALLQYRLDRKSGRNAIPWLKIALGARHDAYVTGYSVAKVYWDYRKRDVGQQPVKRSDGQPLISERTGQPVMQTVYDVIRDRPNARLFPIEQVGIDSAASWENPAQDSSFLFLKEPIYKNDLKAMMTASGDKSLIPWRAWRDVEDQLEGARGQDSDARETRDARSAGVDRYEHSAGSRRTAGGNTLLWLYEWFFDWEGTDFVVFMADGVLLSDPIPTVEAYPEHFGMRPVVIGGDSIEPHELYPQSALSGLQPVQQEINDHVNLRLDAGRMSIFPIAKIRRGRSIDPAQVHRRGPNSSILVNEADDVTFEIPPANVAAAFQETDRLNMDFDEIAGQFSSSSVQSSGELNRTVGGMQILAGDAQATSNMDLRVWAETFVEPLLTMIVNLEQYYETDETILALCATKAKLFVKHGVNLINDQLLASEVMTSVNIGMGATDPQAALGKMASAWQTAQPIIQGDINNGRIQTKPQEILNEIFGAAQFKDGGNRFFTFNEQAAGDPAQLQQQIQALTEENNRLKAQADVKIQTAQIGAQTDIQVAQIKEQAETARELRVTEMELQAGVHESQMRQREMLMQAALGEGQAGANHERTKELQGMKHSQGLEAKDRDARNAIVGQAAPKVMGFADEPRPAGAPAAGGDAGIGQALQMIAQAIAMQTAILNQLVGGGEAPPPPAPPATPEMPMPSGPMPGGDT